MCELGDKFLYSCSVASVMSNSATLWAVSCQAPLSVGSLQARILEWVTVLSSKGSLQPRHQTRIFCVSFIAGRFFTTEPLGKNKVISMLFIVRIFPCLHHRKPVGIMWKQLTIVFWLQLVQLWSWGILLNNKYFVGYF